MSINVISLADRRNENKKRRRGDERQRLCNRLRWFLAADGADKRLMKESLKTVADLDVVMAEYESEAARVILSKRRSIFGFVDTGFLSDSKRLPISPKPANIKREGSLANRVMLCGEVAR